MVVDPAALTAVVGPVVGTVIAYLKTDEGQRAGAAAAQLGGQVLATLRRWFEEQGDQKAQDALAQAEKDPDDPDYQQKLAKETGRLAAAHPAFAEALRALAERAAPAGPGAVVFDNQASNQGVQAGTISGGAFTFGPGKE